MTLTEKSLNDFTNVFKTVQISSVNLREPPGGKIRPTGHVTCNAEASDILVAAGEQRYLSLSKAGILWWVNPATKEVAGRVTALETLGATPIREVSGGTFVLYMHNVFAEYPTLKPSRVISVPMTLHKDDQGLFFVFYLTMAVIPGREGRKERVDCTPEQD
jgi:hypothetical protein